MIVGIDGKPVLTAVPPPAAPASKTAREDLAEKEMANLDPQIRSRICHLMNLARKVTGLPSDINMDERINRFFGFVVQELATMQVVQGRTFARLLDILEKGEASNGHEERRERAPEGVQEEPGAARASD